MEKKMTDKNQIIKEIRAGETSLGIEFGSTRIKAVLVGKEHAPIASGSYEWENQLVDSIWTYSLEDIWKGLQTSYQELAKDVKEQYGEILTKIGSMGFSAMMHGYMPFDEEDNLLVPFRTWRNNITEQATDVLTPLFGQQIPQRWSIAHLYQAILNGEEHVKDITFFTTLAGYIHWKLTGKKVLGVGDASGMFPIDSETVDYNQKMVEQFDELKKEKYRFTKAKEKYKAEHEGELRRFYMAKRKLKEKGFEKEPFPLSAWQKEFSELSAQRENEYQKYKVMQKDLTLLYQIKGDVDKVMRETHPEILHADKTKETTL